MPLARPGDPDPPAARLARVWERYRERIEHLHERADRDVVFTELGYQSRRDTAIYPAGVSGAPDDAAQARAYEAAYRAWAGVEWFDGIWWWDWPAGLSSDPGDFTPRGKPAAAVVARWNAP